MSTNPFETAPNLATSHIKRQDLPTNVRKYADNLAAQIKEVYAKYGAKNFEELKENKKLSAQDARKVADLLKAFNEAVEKKGHVTLRDVPTFTVLPSHDILKDKQAGYGFDYVLNEYREGRPLSDFALTDKDLRDIGFDDLQKREELLQAIAQAKEHKESDRMATVFDIGDVIAKKQRENPSHPDRLTKKEVIEAIDAAGCRPATLEELLAFAKQFWRPDADPATLTDEEKLLQRVNARFIYALAYRFTDSDGLRDSPCVRWNGDKRRLSGGDAGSDGWSGDVHFLVFPKTSS
ncbi:MAG: hypothetical protein WC641_05490 [Patescibacteria group bacterium]